VTPFSAPTRFDLNRLSRNPIGTIAPETGTTGFMIGTDAALQPWNGIIAELVVLNRPITASERGYWQEYVNSRYGI